jgi:hypothetical protein
MDQTTNAGQTLPDTNLWDQAFHRLTVKDPDLAEKYERVLQDGANMPASGNLGLQMRAVIDKRLEVLKSREWKLKW